MVADGKVTVKAVPGAQNVADIGTKILTHDRIEELKKRVGIKNLSELVPRAGAAQAARVAAVGVQTPFAKRVAAMLALLAPRAVATSAAVCRRDLQHFAENKSSDSGPGVVLVVAIVMMAMLIGMAVGLALGCYFGRVVEKVKQKQETFDKQCQSMVTYTRKATVPRFKPLPEAAHG